MHRANIFAIIGSASSHSANLRLVQYLASLMQQEANVTVFDTLKDLPPFDPELAVSTPPQSVIEFRTAIAQADGIIICTPEYIFSMPSGLKNAIEWCVATTVFSDKPTGLVTASASGLKGHEELQLVMRTVMARFTDDTTLLIQGVKGKVDLEGNITDPATDLNLKKFADAFLKLVK